MAKKTSAGRKAEARFKAQMEAWAVEKPSKADELDRLEQDLPYLYLRSHTYFGKLRYDEAVRRVNALKAEVNAGLE